MITEWVTASENDNFTQFLHTTSSINQTLDLNRKPL